MANQMRPPCVERPPRLGPRDGLHWMIAELDDLLLREHGVLPEVQDFHETWTVLRRLVRQGPGRR
jgi:hypothetical protein